MRQISILSREIAVSQIKGRKRTSDLTNFVQQISDNFDEYKKDRNDKDEIRTKLQTQVTELTEKVSNLLVQADKQEQHSSRNCLLINGVEEN